MTNSLAMEVVEQVFDFLRNGTANDPRIGFQTLVYTNEDETVRALILLLPLLQVLL